MQIKMLSTRRGSENGHTVRQFDAGETYDVADTLAKGFISARHAVEVNPKGMDEVLQETFLKERERVATMNGAAHA